MTCHTKPLAKYGADKNEKVITGIKRISKPGLRVYANAEDMPKVLGGLGIAIVSTNKGVLTDKEARKQNEERLHADAAASRHEEQERNAREQCGQKNAERTDYVRSARVFSPNV